jgi:hypothetical protein
MNMRAVCIASDASSARQAEEGELRSVQRLRKHQLLRDFSSLVARDRWTTARMLAYIGEIDRRKLYLERAYPSMFAFCTKRFRMSEAIAAKRIRAGRAGHRFPCILRMVRRGELHLSGVHQLAGHLTESNHREVLRRAKHRSMREIDELIAEISPKPDAGSLIRALPRQRAVMGSAPALTHIPSREESRPESLAAQEVACERDDRMKAPRFENLATPLSPGRYRLQVTIGQKARDALVELQSLLSHQIPDGGLSPLIERALKALLEQIKKKKAALFRKPRRPRPGRRAQLRSLCERWAAQHAEHRASLSSAQPARG